MLLTGGELNPLLSQSYAGQWLHLKSVSTSRHDTRTALCSLSLSLFACCSRFHKSSLSFAFVIWQSQALQSFRPDVIVGSSFGGAIVLELIQRGMWSGPAVLICPAHKVIARCHNVSEDKDECGTKGFRTDKLTLSLTLSRVVITSH